MGAFKRAIADSLDLGLLAMLVLFFYGLNYAFGSVLASVQSSYIFTILASPDPLLAFRPALFSALSALSDPLTLLSIVLYGLIFTYLNLVIIGWIGKRRIGYPENPFRRAVEALVPFIILGIIVFAPVALFLSLMLYFASSATLLVMFFILFVAFTLVYTPIVAPAMVSIVLDADTVSKALKNGFLVGRRHWVKILLLFVAAAIVMSILQFFFGVIAYYVPALSDFLLVLLQAISLVIGLAVLTEVYIEDAHGV